jgi:hypothetical protein
VADPIQGILPRIAWDNALAAGVLSASSVAPGHDPAFVADGTLYRTWMPAAGGGTETLEVAWPAARLLTTWCLYGHTGIGSIGLEIWNGAIWLPVAGGPVLALQGCCYRTMDPIPAQRARFVVTAAGPEPFRIASLFLGMDLICASGLRPGWVDPELGQMQQVVHATSRTGIPLPSIVEDEYLEGHLVLPDVPWTWARESWLPFKRHAQTRPFFLRWHDDALPAYCHSARMDEEQFTRPGMVTVGLTCRMEVR